MGELPMTGMLAPAPAHCRCTPRQWQRQWPQGVEGLEAVAAHHVGQGEYSA
jgi:hypothetical protein